MNTHYKLIFVSMSILLVILAFFTYSFFHDVSYHDHNQLDQWNYSLRLLTHPFNYKNSSINLQGPIAHERLLDLGTYGVKFVLYEDFILNTDKPLDIGSFKIANLPDEAWAKLIINEKNQTMLRMMGYTMPGTSTPFNNTLFLVPTNMGHSSTNAITIPIVKNTILEKIDVLRYIRPIKFGNEIFAYQNSTFGHIFGIVYDNTSIMSNLEINIEPIGLVSNNTISNMPTWLKIVPMRMPLVLQSNEPDYYVIKVSTINAKPGLYEIAFKEQINNQTYVETASLTVL